jgi:hypothetical protein
LHAPRGAPTSHRFGMFDTPPEMLGELTGKGCCS